MTTIEKEKKILTLLKEELKKEHLNHFSDEGIEALAKHLDLWDEEEITDGRGVYDFKDYWEGSLQGIKESFEVDDIKKIEEWDYTILPLSNGNYIVENPEGE